MKLNVLNTKKSMGIKVLQCVCLFQLIGMLLMLLYMFLNPCVAAAALVEMDNLKYTEFVPGEVIIKFNLPVFTGASKKISKDGLTGDPHLNKLFQKWHVKGIKKVFKGLEEVMAKTNTTSAQVFQQIRQKFPSRSKRVPPNTPTIRLDNIYKLKVPPDTDIIRLCLELKSNPNVAYAHPNYIFRINFLPNDPFFGSSGSWGQSYDDLWGLKIIESADAWDFSTGQGVVVAVVDTGIDYNHQEIRDNIWINAGEDINNNGVMDADDFNDLDDDGNGYIDDLYGWNFVHDNNDPMDGHGHGTHVAGTISASGNNEVGITGLAFNSKAMPLKGLDDEGYGVVTNEADAIVYAANNGAEVINMSFGGPLKLDLLQDAIDYAYSLGVVMVAAAGNSFGDDAANHWPSGYENVIAVSSTDQNDTISDFSNIGVKIDVSAPGGGSVNDDDPEKLGRNILSIRAAGTDMYGDGICIVDGDYYRTRGTSMAAPHVSGLAALIISKNPLFTNEEIRQAIRTSADDIDAPGWDLNTGYGRINAYKALQIEAIPIAKIILPETNTNVSRGLIDIVGTASSPNFETYSVEYGSGINPSTWSQINTSNIPVVNNILASWDTTSLPMGDYMLRLTVASSGLSVEDRVLVTITPEPQVGFPIQMEDANPVLTLSDVNHDGFKDIILDGPHSINIYDSHGSSLTGWPLSFPNSTVVSAVSAAELDLSYEGEELAVVIRESDDSHFLHLYHADGTEITTGGWPKLIAGRLSRNAIIGCAPILIDIDSDRELEIIQTSYENELVGGVTYFRTTIQLWHFDGTDVQGQWPRTVITQQGAINPSVGNIDDDWELEIAIGDKDGQLHIFNHDGSYVNGWPKAIANDELFTTTMADIDKDSLAEVMVQARDGSVHILNGDGSEVNGWSFLPPETMDIPLEISSFSQIMPTAGDLDQDGQIEVIMIYDRIIYVINHTGMIKDGWPKYLPGGIAGNTLNCVVGDIDGDFRQEIVVTTAFSPHIYAFNMEGKRLEGWPVALDAMFSFTSGALADLDRDGDMEVLAVTTFPTKLHVFDNPSEGRGHRLDWPMLRHDAQHTQALLPLGDVNGDWSVDVIDVQVAINVILGIPEFTMWRYPGADVNQDGVVNVCDAQRIINIILGVD